MPEATPIPNTQVITSPWVPIIDKVGVPLLWIALGVAVGYYAGSKRR